MRRFRGFAVGVVMALLSTILLVISPQSAKGAETDLCSSSMTTQNGLKAIPSHGQVFYIDSGVTPRFDASYAGYQITSTTARSNLWVELTSFTGGKVVLADSDDKYQQIESISAGGSKTTFFLLKALGSSLSTQKHIVKVWSGRPDLNTSTMLLSCYFQFSKVVETIKAKANKVTNISVSNSTPTLASSITITVDGATGTIGQGSAPDGDIVWLSPAALSTWPTQALRLESTTLQFYNNASRNAGQAVGPQFNDQLFIKPATAYVSGGTTYNFSSAGYYRAVYTFRVIGAAPVTQAIPVAQISSGTQIKHSPTDGLTGNSIDLRNVYTGQITTSKNVGSFVYSSNSVTSTYTVTVATTASGTLKLDEVVDYPSTDMTYVAASARYTDTTGSGKTLNAEPSTSTADTGISPPPLHYTGPFYITSARSLVLTYKMTVPCSSTATSYANSAYAYSGGQKIGASTTTVSRVTLTTSLTGGSCTADPVIDTPSIDPTVTTQQPSSVTDVSATLNGQISVSGATLTVWFEWGTSPTLATFSSTVNQTGLSTDQFVSANLSGLTGSTQYYYRVKANWSKTVSGATTSGTVSGSIVDFRTNSTIYNAAPTVTTDAASSITSTGAVLQGHFNPNQQAITRIDFLYSSTSSSVSSGVTTVTVLDDTGANLTFAAGGAVDTYVNYSLSSLTAGTKYYYKLRVYCTVNTYCTNASGIYDASNIANFTTGAPTVETLDATAVTSTTATLNGNASFDSAMNIYFSYCASSGTCTSSSLGASPNSTPQQNKSSAFNGSVTADIAGLTPGTTYYFLITAATTAATPVQNNGSILSFTTPKADQTITFNNSSRKYDATATSPGATTTSGLTITYSISAGSTSICSMSADGTLTPLRVGLCTLTASQAGNASYNAALNKTATITITRDITVTARGASKAYGASDPSLNYDVSPALFSGDTLTGNPSRAPGETVGSYTINVDSISGSYYNITRVNGTFSIGQATQTITFNGGSKRYEDGSFAPGASTTAPGLSITYSSDTTSICTTDGTTITPVRGGTCTLRANQPGNTNYAAAAEKSASFTITKDISISVQNKSKTYGDADPAFSYTLSTSLFSGDSVSGSLTRASGENVGSYTISALGLSLPSYYNVLGRTSGTLTINQASQTISFSGGTKPLDSGAFGAGGSASSTLAVSYTTRTPSICTVSGSTITPILGGICTIRASQSGNSNYQAASDVDRDFTITDVVTLTVDNKNKVKGDSDPTFTFKTNPVSYDSLISVTLSRADTSEANGTYTISATVNSKPSYLTVNVVTGNLTISEIALTSQTITFDNSSTRWEDHHTDTTLHDPGANASSKLSVSYESLTTDVCTVGAGGVKYLRAGICRLVAKQPGNSTYAAANNVNAEITVTRDITISGKNSTKVYGTSDPSLDYTLSSDLFSGDNATGSVTRASGENVGTYNVLVTGIALPSYYNVTRNAGSFTITQASQTISFSGSNKKYESGNFTLAATASSTLSVTYESRTTSICTVSGNTVTPIRGGTCTVRATQSGNGNYKAASYVDADHTITRDITVTAVDKSKASGTATDPELEYTITPTLFDGDSLSVALSRVPGETVGSYVISVGTISGPSYYNITKVNGSFNIAAFVKSSQSITFSNGELSWEDHNTDSTAANPGASASSKLAVSYTSTTPSICVIVGGKVKVLRGGTCNLQADQNGDDTYEAASTKNASFTVTRKITITAIDKSKSQGAGDPDLTYTLSDPLFDGDSLTGSLTREAGETPGSYRIRANGLSGAAYYRFIFVDGTLTVISTGTGGGSPDPDPAPPALKKAQKIEFPSLKPQEFRGNTIALNPEAKASSSLEVNYVAGPSSICAMENGKLVVRSIGLCSITAEQKGNDQYEPAAPVTVTVPTQITVTIKAQRVVKPSGSPDPVLTYQVDGLILPGTSFAGSLTREPGEIPGTYRITQGSLSLPPGYVINFVAAELLVDPLKATYTPLSLDKTKVIWTAPPDTFEKFVVTRNDRVLCTTSSTSCVVPVLLGPKSRVDVTAITTDGEMVKSRAQVLVDKLVQAMNVYFDTDKYVIKSADKKRLSQVGKLLDSEGYNNFVISGNTDSKWKADYNVQLSKQRAFVVKAYLENLIKDFTVKLGYFGASRPAASNQTDSGRALNRRTALEIAQPIVKN